MEDSLRYFFSAIFQGIAAILALGAMFYMNFMDRTKNRINELILNTLRDYNPPAKKTEIEKSNIIEVMKVNLLPTMNRENSSDQKFFMIAEEYDSLKSKKDYLNSKLPGLIRKGILLLVLSGVAMLCIGFYAFLNYLMYGVAILCVALTFIFLLDLKKIIFHSTELA